MRLSDIYYTLKPLIPRRVQIELRRRHVARLRHKHHDVWPIDRRAAKAPEGWKGWPDGRKFSLVLTHDVDTARGQGRCRDLMALEKALGFRSSFNFVPKRYEVYLGFRSSFNFVPKRYEVYPHLRKTLMENGFEVGVHGLYHDGRYYTSRAHFSHRARQINAYLKEWNAVGFRSPSMLHNLDWIGELEIEYDASTFDTDPFEPQSDGVFTIFPFMVPRKNGQPGYVEMPYTLPQDFTLFVLMKEKGIDVWRRKLKWIAEKGGMVLLNTHPDYMAFGEARPGLEEFSSDLYWQFLEHLKSDYDGQYWHALPREVARFWRTTQTK